MGEQSAMRALLLGLLILAQILLTAALNAHKDDSSTEAVALGEIQIRDVAVPSHLRSAAAKVKNPKAPPQRQKKSPALSEVVDLRAQVHDLTAKNAALVAKIEKLEAAAAECSKGLGEANKVADVTWVAVGRRGGALSTSSVEH